MGRVRICFGRHTKLKGTGVVRGSQSRRHNVVYYEQHFWSHAGKVLSLRGAVRKVLVAWRRHWYCRDELAAMEGR